MREQMTAEQATHFDHFSPANMAIILHALTCECDPYKDVFTYNRWIAQGRQVQRGEHGIKLPLVRAGRDEDGIMHRYLGHSVVFCRCQTDAKG